MSQDHEIGTSAGRENNFPLGHSRMGTRFGLNLLPYHFRARLLFHLCYGFLILGARESHGLVVVIKELQGSDDTYL